MGLFMVSLLIILGFIVKLCTLGENVKTFFDAQNSNNPTYTDSNGNIRNSSNGHKVDVDTDGREYDSWTGELLYTPYKKLQALELERAINLGYTKHKVIQSNTSHILNMNRYGHRIIYKDNDITNYRKGVPYGKLQCNLGYEFYVNLNTGAMEETELSKSIPHTKLKKYHVKPSVIKHGKTTEYINDYDNPYTEEEIIKENEEILRHLHNHNYNITVRQDTINKRQKFTPNWCYNPESPICITPVRDNIIVDYEMKKYYNDTREGYYD